LAQALSALQTIFPNIANYMTGVPIASKHTRSVEFAGGMHYAVTFTSGSARRVVRFVFQYYIGLVTKQPFPDIGLKQKLS
jgi:hypothetical protein